jgi:hypothetical protein
MEVLTGKKNDRSRARRFEPALYAFPSYDKCDSLLYFPNAMSRHTNSGDFAQLSRLFGSHLESDCHIALVDLNPSSKQLGRLFCFFTEVYPDFMMCVHSTRVEGKLTRLLLL